ncbi:MULTISPECIES: hypothetical protein [unclassified Endozoicomonas]|uniref:hypothetical protein n=1 Tax=unclassified Endozoicomonas TaxID=2644528 RepID=UPI00214720C1|nr:MULTISPECIES: hypothetical protein [unclassified Endozoicomonas]
MLKSIAIPVAAIVGELLSAMPAQAENSLKPDLLNGEQLARRMPICRPQPANSLNRTLSMLPPTTAPFSLIT